MKNFDKMYDKGLITLDEYFYLCEVEEIKTSR